MTNKTLTMVGLCAVAAVLTNCKNEQQPSAGGTPSASVTGPVASASYKPGDKAGGSQQGLAEKEVQDLYHLAEGSEIFPLSWLVSLKTKAGRPFLEEAEKLGLLPDPDPTNVYKLPVGMTAHKPSDFFGGTMMVGFNCAACHVGEIRHQGKSLRILGAPNMFDIKGFYAELFASGEDTLKHVSKLIDFASAVYRFKEIAPPPASPSPAPNPAIAMAEMTETVELWKGMPEPDKLDDYGKLEDALADRIDEIYKEEAKKEITVPPEQLALLETPPGKFDPVEPLYADVDTPPERDVMIGKKLKSTLKENVKSDSPVAMVAVEKREQSFSQFLSGFKRNIRLLKSRLGIVLTLREIGKKRETPAGPGRVDAFGTARNLIFTKEAKDTLSPVSYPHLWGFEKIAWLHWDANTNSVMERNMGQAIGLGAVFDSKGDSTLLPRSIHRLETVAAKIQPPSWPAWLGSIDAEKAGKGKTIFEAKCKGCHFPEAAGSEQNDKLLAIDAIKTDPIRATSFANKVGNDDFSAALARELREIKAKAYERAKAKDGVTDDEIRQFEKGREQSVWRTTQKYPTRPLAAAWATAPYLHNASVPTLADLLLPADKRPKCFLVGPREYDPKKLGYKYDPSQDCKAPAPAGTFLLNTELDGNSNKGHDFGTDLPDADKDLLLEYLKTL